jgi:hypothetical protein
MRTTFEIRAKSTGRNPFVADAVLQHGQSKRMGKVSGKYAKHEYHVALWLRASGATHADASVTYRYAEGKSVACLR